MRFQTKDVISTALVVAIAVPYVGFLVNGEMPLIKDERGMAAVGLVLALAAYLVMERGDAVDRTDKMEIGLAVASLAIGAAALVLAETAAAEVLLATFMGSVLVVWAVKVMDHTGMLHIAGHHPIGHA